jgi:hypothetical protein
MSALPSAGGFDRVGVVVDGAGDERRLAVVADAGAAGPADGDVAGTADRILPITATADGLPGLIANVRLVRVEGGPHNIGWTHPDEVNMALLEFVDQRDKKLAGS